jgi:hypothetical protein
LIRKLTIGFVVVLAISVGAYFHFHHRKPPLETAYAGNRQVTLWSSTAQVREEVATVDFGERLDVLERFGDQDRVRTKAGLVGWTNEDQLLSADAWQKARDLDAQTAALSLQAKGQTRERGNLHVDAARDSARIWQLDRGVPMELFERRTVDVPTPPGATGANTAAGAGGAEGTETRKEEWWLVRAQVSLQHGQIGQPDAAQFALSGWILGRFVDLDVPEPLPNYASSAGMRIVAWFELNHVIDADGNQRPQYLVVGARGSEGQPCDFTLMRAFTWGQRKERYETAFVESDLCGKLPVRLTAAKAPGGDATFTFEDWGAGKSEMRTYRMHQTIIRRVLERQTTGAKPALRAKGARKKHVRA